MLLVEPSRHLGGLMSSGLGRTDIGPRTTIGGLFRTLVTRLRDEYAASYGPESPQVADCKDGYELEPSRVEAQLDALVAEQPGITVWRGWRLGWEGGPSLLEGGRWLVEMAPGAGPAEPEKVPERRVTAVVLEAVDAAGEATGERRRVAARVFVDATYEGDLALGAGAEYRIGREGREEQGEAHAGVLYQDFRSKLCYPGSTGRADRRVQAYNYRLCLTRDPANRRPISRPATYVRSQYAALVDDVAAGRVKAFMGWGSVGVLNQATLPNGKTDCNNHHYCLTSTDWPEASYDYPEAGPNRRRQIAQAHWEYTEGLLWFCQHDPALPDWFREEAQQWGYAADEFADNGGFPRQMYVREAARIRGDYFFTARDASRAADGGRAPVFWDAIACGGYGIDSHATRQREDRDLPPEADEDIPDGRRIALEGFFSIASAPYQLPYRIMLPEGIDGLLVPVAVSATHLGYGTIRMEPTWMALGEAAGAAAALSVRHGVRPREVPRGALQRTLVRFGQVITYLQDVPPPRFPGHEDLAPDLWEALQLWGTRGFFSTYDARPDQPLAQGEAARWLWLLRREVDPWTRVQVDPAAFAAGEPISRTAFLRALDAALADPSPLRRHLGAPPPAPPALRSDVHDEPMTRGGACLLLYELYAPLI